MIDDNSKEFIKRHIGPSEEDQSKMLQYVGYKSLEDLMSNTVPEKILLKDDLKIDQPMSENDALKKLKSISKKNKIFKNFIGMGYYNSITPNVILRNILENPGWYTSYTPYQPEVAQGRLEMLLNFQQSIIDLTGMDIANASLLDEATATAEAVGLSQRLDKTNSKKIFISSNCNPQTIDLIKTRTNPFGLELIIGDEKKELSKINEDIICGVLSYPGTLGEINDPSESISQIHKKNGKAILVCDLLALARLKTPAELGADIAVGSAQRFGIPMGYGGPHAAFFATKEEFKRSMPGRIIGVSKDRHGKKAYRLSLQTREQHIRREKATSNICTSQVLLAIMSSMYAVYNGPKKIKYIAQTVNRQCNQLAESLLASGIDLFHKKFFDTIRFKPKNDWEPLAENAKFNFRKYDDGSVGTIHDSLLTEFQTRNGRKVFDGGGINPDIIIEKKEFGNIIVSLFKERLFFDYVTDFRFNNDTISKDFSFSDQDFNSFIDYLSDKEYSYKTKTEQSLENFKKKAIKEDYFDSVKEDYEKLVDNLELNKNNDLNKNKKQIEEILMGEIMSRYFYQKGRIESSLAFDDEFKKALEILQNQEEYDKILEDKI